ncbi:MAG: divergent PAP2 family protein [Oscillospiraceae bacterium]|nr:divergent PAP2 family protein [Oscillospiraceae bacterium]
MKGVDFKVEFFYDLLNNYALVCSILGWTLAQIFKFILTLVVNRRLEFERLFGAGGMPSGHSATVTALVIAVSRQCGVSSVEFAIATVIASVVIYDAMGVRHEAGKHAQVINQMVKVSKEDDIPENDISANELKESLGHTPLEVLGGIMLGILIPVILPMNVLPVGNL